MFKVRNIFTGEIRTVYAINPGGYFLFFAPINQDGFITWVWDDWEKYVPVEE